MITNDDLLTLLPGSRAVVVACEAREHGDNSGCLCALRGHTVIIGERKATVFAGTPSWWISSTKTARLSELILLKAEAGGPNEPL